MSRGLTVAALNATSSEVPIRTVAIELDFPSGFVRMNGSPASLTLNGNEFLGVGGLGAITVAEETAELRAFDLTVSLSGIPRDSVALALTQAYQGRRGTIWEVPISAATYLPIADPIVIFKGRMDQLDVRIGDTATVSVKMLNRLADWERPKLRRYTDIEQKMRNPSDNGLRFVAASAEKMIVWPGLGWKG